MAWFGNKEPKEVPRETTDEEEAEATLKFHTASARFGPVGRIDWKKAEE